MAVSRFLRSAPLPAPASTAVEAQLLVSSALHLMTHYSAQAAAGGGGQLASVIERHLMALAGHGELSAVLRATCQQLAQQWAAVGNQSVPEPPRSLFARILRRRRA